MALPAFASSGAWGGGPLWSGMAQMQGNTQKPPYLRVIFVIYAIETRDPDFGRAVKSLKRIWIGLISPQGAAISMRCVRDLFGNPSRPVKPSVRRERFRTIARQHLSESHWMPKIYETTLIWRLEKPNGGQQHSRPKAIWVSCSDLYVASHGFEHMRRLTWFASEL